MWVCFDNNVSTSHGATSYYRQWRGRSIISKRLQYWCVENPQKTSSKVTVSPRWCAESGATGSSSATCFSRKGPCDSQSHWHITTSLKSIRLGCLPWHPGHHSHPLYPTLNLGNTNRRNAFAISTRDTKSRRIRHQWITLIGRQIDMLVTVTDSNVVVLRSSNSGPPKSDQWARMVM